jgi:3-mercaptopyruvate sulfurtransferase SseA
MTSKAIKKQHHTCAACGLLFIGEEKVHLHHVDGCHDNWDKKNLVAIKSFDELQALFTSKGITPDKEVFPYCAVGGRSAYIWFVLKYLLGYPHVRNYDGSWNEWSHLPNVAIEK